MASSTSLPVGSNTFDAPPTSSSWPNHGRIPSARSTGSLVARDWMVPNAPGDAPINPTGRSPKTRSADFRQSR